MDPKTLVEKLIEAAGKAGTNAEALLAKDPGEIAQLAGIKLGRHGLTPFEFCQRRLITDAAAELRRAENAARVKGLIARDADLGKGGVEVAVADDGTITITGGPKIKSITAEAEEVARVRA